MDNFDVEYYTIQYRVSAEGPWLKPKTKPKPLKKKDDWGFASFDNFSLNPLLRKQKRYVDDPYYYKWPAAEQEVNDIWQKSGEKGWYSLKFAVRALKWVREQNALGKNDYFDTYRNKCQSIRHEFRIVKVRYTKKINIVAEVAVDAVAEVFELSY